MDPAAFAEARLAEDEARAARAKSLRDKLDDPRRQITPDVRDGAEHAWHETAADPARMLREVAAHRAILAEHKLVPAGYVGEGVLPGEYGCRTCHCHEHGTDPEGLCVTARAVLLIWAGHKDYDQDWAP
jgi:hypothetical protein